MNYKLAINGGKNIRKEPWPVKRLYNKSKIKNEVANIIESDNLSGYRGSFGQHFWGGQSVKELESFFENYLFEKSGIKSYVLAVNSCTSALHVACGAIGLNYASEVIVTPWSMTCSATAPKIYDAKPIFADIEKDYFCLDVKSIEEKITDRTKAIIAVDLFGQPYDVEAINALAKKHNLFVIEDCAQALGAAYVDEKGSVIPVGLLGDIGCFSFTQGKHFTCGEGGFIVTKNEELYMKCALLRNHAEAVINSMPDNLSYKHDESFKNLCGFNLRMTEIQARILLEQFKSSGNGLSNNIEIEVKARNYLVDKIKEIDLPGILWGETRGKNLHAYYVLPFLFDENVVGVSRHTFIEAVKAELRIEKTNMGITQKIEPLIWEGYIKPIYRMPFFNYYPELETVENLQNNTFCFTTFQGLPLKGRDIIDISDAFYKVYENLNELKDKK